MNKSWIEEENTENTILSWKSFESVAGENFIKVKIFLQFSLNFPENSEYRVRWWENMEFCVNYCGNISADTREQMKKTQLHMTKLSETHQNVIKNFLFLLKLTQ